MRRLIRNKKVLSALFISIVVLVSIVIAIQLNWYNFGHITGTVEPHPGTVMQEANLDLGSLPAGPVALVSASMYFFNPALTVNPNPYSATPAPPLPANATCLQDVLPNTSTVVSYSYSRIGCLGLTVGVSANETYLNDSVTISVWLSNLYTDYTLALYGMALITITITNILNHSVYSIGINQPCATPCYATTTKVVLGSAYSFYPRIWSVSTSPYAEAPVEGNATYTSPFSLLYLIIPL